MLRSHLICTLASVALAASLAACQQNVEDKADTAADAAAPADVTVVDPPDNVTVVKPDLPDVDINPPKVEVNPPGETTTRESTTVTVPGVGSSTTTVEKR